MVFPYFCEHRDGTDFIGGFGDVGIFNNINSSLWEEQCWEDWITTRRSMKVDPFLTPLPKENLKWTKGVNTAPDTVKIPEENPGELLDLASAVTAWIRQRRHRQQKQR